MGQHLNGGQQEMNSLHLIWVRHCLGMPVIAVFFGLERICSVTKQFLNYTLGIPQLVQQ